MADRQIYVHQNHNANEIRNFSVEKLAAHPAGANLYAGRIWELNSDGGLYYSPDGGAIERLVTEQQAESRVRFVGSLNVASGSVPLVTPFTDSVNGEATWDAGDKGVVTVAGTLVPAPGGGSAVVQVGDVIMALVDNPAGNGDFVVIESNLPANLPTVNAPLVVAPGDWVGAPGAWVATKALANAASRVVALTVRDGTTNELVVFGTVLGVGSVALQASTPAAPTGTYVIEAIVR